MEELLALQKDDVIQESSVWAIIGRRGHGKSALLAHIAEIDYNKGKKIVSNFYLNFPHTQMTFEELVLLPKTLQNATVVFDEFQVGAGARNALRNANKSINQFITQLRKRNIILYFATQNFKYVDIDVRSQSDFLLNTEAIDTKDEDNNKFKVIIIDRFDMTDSRWGTVVNDFTWDATDLFSRNVYNTNEIISFGEE